MVLGGYTRPCGEGTRHLLETNTGDGYLASIVTDFQWMSYAHGRDMAQQGGEQQPSQGEGREGACRVALAHRVQCRCDSVHGDPSFRSLSGKGACRSPHPYRSAPPVLQGCRSTLQSAPPQAALTMRASHTKPTQLQPCESQRADKRAVMELPVILPVFLPIFPGHGCCRGAD